MIDKDGLLQNKDRKREDLKSQSNIKLRNRESQPLLKIEWSKFSTKIDLDMSECFELYSVPVG
jgi:hypothetical protein